MPTIVFRHDEDQESAEILRGHCMPTYLNGECYAFATALHEGLGWPILGLMIGTEIRHAVVQDPEGFFHDARGRITEEELGSPFGLVPPYDIREVTVADLVREGEPDYVRAHSVRLARRLAEAIWPELPWKDSIAIRIASFADELEALCRRHQLWIRAPVPAAAPVIALGDGDESGYQLRRIAGGLTFTIERYFK